MKILYFAWLRERVGLGEEEVDPPAEIGTVAQLIAWLSARSPGHASAFAPLADGRRLVRCAVNQDFAQPDALVSPGDEIAFFPPVTGG
jgi:molybdopterin converting factor subunit 1